MRVIYIVLDGLPDDNIIDGSTPIEVADAPTIHSIAGRSMPLMIKSSFPGLPVGSIVANLGLLGYDPYKYFPSGRSYFELIARYDQPVREGDLILRVNTISIDEHDNISDFTAGQISDELGTQLIDQIRGHLPSTFTLVRGKNYRNTMIVRNSSLRPKDILAFEPHSRIGENIFDLRLRHATTNLSLAQKTEIRQLNAAMLSTIMHFRHFNQTYGSKADMLWFWAPSGVASLFDFRSRYKFNKAHIIAGSDFMYGIGKAAGISFTANEKYTGEADTDFSGKGAEAVRLLQDGADFLFVHVNATDEEAHQRKYDSKKRMIELIDHHIVSPIKQYMDSQNDRFVMLIGGDHYTSSKSGNHLDLDTPFIFYDSANSKNGISRFSEKEISQKSTVNLNSHNIIDWLRNQLPV